MNDFEIAGSAACFGFCISTHMFSLGSCEKLEDVADAVSPSQKSPLEEMQLPLLVAFVHTSSENALSLT